MTSRGRNTIDAEFSIDAWEIWLGTCWNALFQHTSNQDYFQAFFFTHLIKRSRVRISFGRRLISLNYTTFKRFFFAHVLSWMRSRVRIPLGRRLMSLNYTTFKRFFHTSNYEVPCSNPESIVGSYRWMTLLSSVFLHMSNHEVPGSNPARSAAHIVELHYLPAFFFLHKYYHEVSGWK